MICSNIVDVDECSVNPCKEGNICNNTLGSFVCDCLPDYLRNDDGSCSKVEHSGIPVGAIVGIVVGIICAILITGGVLYYKLRNRLDLSKLPEDIRMHYQAYYDTSGSII